jgi:O-antigen chain-terminating methyltransferase
MAKLRTWLNEHPLGAPYRGLRDLLRLSANRRQILDHISRNQREHNESLQRLEREISARLVQSEQVQAQRGALLEQQRGLLEQQGARLDRLERLEHENARILNILEPLSSGGQLPFSHTQAAPNWIANAERLLGQPLADLTTEQRDHWFYSFYSEMAGGVGHILEHQYQVYLPLLPTIPNARVLDIGCGAGEFLNFLRSNGVPAMGIDLDAHEVERANERGLTAVHAEATEYLTRCGEKFSAISLFQVIEHVPPALIRPLIEACTHALAPGGALLIETINLRNPNAVNGFYTDPTHQVPLSDNYMSFVFQWNQLENVEFIYTLPEWMPGISAQDRPRCYANYTVIGYKKA